MISEKSLVSQVMEEVYERLKEKEEEKNTLKQYIVIDDETLRPIVELNKNYKVQLYTDTLNSCDIVILSQCSIDLLSHMALGLTYSSKEKFLMKILLEGKVIYILEDGIEYRRYKYTAHRNLYTLYSDYEDKIQKYGVKVVHNIMEIVTKQALPLQSRPRLMDLEIKNKKLISESDFLEIYKQGILEVVVAKKSIITPLAEDFARTHHLTIRRV